jgi:excinuclease ABC subunit C
MTGSNLKGKVRELPDKPGVYIMRDRLGRVIYVGKARSLRKRVSQYFHPSRRMAWDPKIRALVDSIADFEVHVVGSEPEALLLEGKLIKEYKPRYNAMLKDDKRFLMVKVNLNEEYPRFKFARLKKNDGAQYFGPFAHAGAVRRVMQFARKKYGVLIAGSAPIKSDDLKYSTYLVPVPLAEISTEEYRQRVDKACAFLEGRSQDDIAALEEQMRDAARQRQFEKAAELRDLIGSLKELAQSARQRKFARDMSPKIDHEREMADLRAALSLAATPRHIEGFDISNISGTLSVASAVCFQNGKPHKDHYRHYQIKTVAGADDFASMAEVVSRRYGRIQAEGGTMPDLVMVDGGKGQLAAACDALEKLGLSDLPVIGLAKQYEEIFMPDRTESIRLPSNSPGLHLIQRLRDEAHRFANAYHQTLRRRVIQESVLDEFSGLGEKRKRALLRRFGSIARLRRATADEIAQTPGFGPATAAELRKFLDAAV